MMTLRVLSPMIKNQIKLAVQEEIGALENSVFDGYLDHLPPIEECTQRVYECLLVAHYIEPGVVQYGVDNKEYKLFGKDNLHKAISEEIKLQTDPDMFA